MGADVSATEKVFHIVLTEGCEVAGMKSAVVLLSGGLDSATVLAMARSQGYACHALSVDYGQRHRAELLAAQRVARALGTAEHRIIHMDLTAFGGSALTDSSIPVPQQPTEGIPLTYVPARNTIMLSLALAWAEVLGAQDIFVGVNAVDYSGYPDCRPEYIEAFERMANLATKAAVEGRRLSLHAPLISLSKAQIVQQGAQLGVDYSLTVSCYQADEEGRACGICDSCRLRRAGFEAAGMGDPTRYSGASGPR
jgi:7-cyano-7-deazaguanine synthase